jgi:splicing factor 3B subunit 3
MTISSPLEASKTQVMCFHMVAVDVGFDHPIFACLEVDCSELDQDYSGDAFKDIQKVVSYYELDLGLNHVVRKWSEQVDLTANHLIAIPGGKDGPSGVLVCSHGWIAWKHPDCQTVRIPIPSRPTSNLCLDHNSAADSAQNIIVITSVVHRLKKSFFVLVQTELGDVFKVTMDYLTPDGTIGPVTCLKIKYFETLPPATGICLLKSGFLFLAVEFGNQYLNLM